MFAPTTVAAAATANDVATLEAAFCAFVLFPVGQPLTGFSSPDQMLRVFTDTVCTQLTNDYDPIPTEVFDVFLDLGLGPFPPTYRDAAAAVIRSWRPFAERFAANFAPATPVAAA